MKKKALLLIALLLVVGGLIGVTYAWLTDTDSDEFTYTVGNVSYTVSAVADKTLVVPGQELLDTGFAITNSSTVATHIRASITVTGAITLDQYLLGLGAGWTLDADGYYYLGSKATPTAVAARTNPANPFSSIKLDGTKVGNANANATGSVTILFEVKQADNVTWDEMGSINFSTGLAG